MSEYLAMDGYAAFVWPSYALVLATLAILAVASGRARAKALAELAAEEGGEP